MSDRESKNEKLCMLPDEIAPDRSTYEEIRAKLDEAEELIDGVRDTFTSLKEELLGLIKELEEGR